MLNINFLNNKYMSSGLTLFLVLYAGLAAPQLPERITNLFENEIFKLFIMFMIAYMSTKNTTTALLVAICFAISLQTLTKQKINSQLINLLDQAGQVNDDTKTVKFNEVDNQYYDNNDDFYKMMSEKEYDSIDSTNLTSDNGLGWDSYLEETSDYAAF